MTTADLSFSFNSFELRCQFVSVMIHLALIHIQNPVSKTEFRVRDVATSSNSLIMLISEDQHNEERYDQSQLFNKSINNITCELIEFLII